MEYRLIMDRYLNPYENMAIDEALLTAISQNKSPPTLRVYQWKPATLSLGCFQKIREEVDIEFCKTHNLGIVRRFTGGRSVLHDDEITYSVTLPSNSEFYKKSVIESYKEISSALFTMLELCGLHPEFAKSSVKKEDHTSSACFDAPSWYELLVNCKKVVGSAQKRTQHALCQHGSVPLTMDIDILFNCLKFPSDEVKKRIRQSFISKATGINHELHKKITLDNLRNNVILGFEKAFDAKFTLGTLSMYEKEMVSDLQTKYSSDKWNYKF